MAKRMITIERDFLARWVREMKQRQDSGNRDYYTGYVSAMSTVEGMLAMCPEYDLGKLAEVADVVNGECLGKRIERALDSVEDDAMGF